jgi:hypothetical protein
MNQLCRTYRYLTTSAKKIQAKVTEKFIPMSGSESGAESKAESEADPNPDADPEPDLNLEPDQNPDILKIRIWNKSCGSAKKLAKLVVDSFRSPFDLSVNIRILVIK